MNLEAEITYWEKVNGKLPEGYKKKIWRAREETSIDPNTRGLRSSDVSDMAKKRKIFGSLIYGFNPVSGAPRVWKETC